MFSDPNINTMLLTPTQRHCLSFFPERVFYESQAVLLLQVTNNPDPDTLVSNFLALEFQAEGIILRASQMLVKHLTKLYHSPNPFSV